MIIVKVNDSDLANAIKFAMKAAKERFWPGPFRNRVVVNEVSEALGHEIAKYTHTEGLVDSATKISSFWRDNGLGDMKVVRAETLLIEIRNCYDCVDPNMGLTLAPCTFKEKLLKTIFKDVLNHPVGVKEVECCGAISKTCRFEVVFPHSQVSRIRKGTA